MRKKRNTPEFLFVFYFFGFAMLRPAVLLLRAYSGIVIACFLAGTLMVSLFHNHAFRKADFLAWAVFAVLLEGILAFSPAEVRAAYMVNFFMYGVMPLFLLINVTDYALVLHWVVRLSCVNGILLIIDPFIGYQLNGSYMSYGLNLLMFSFSGLPIGYFYLKNRRFLLPLIVEMIMILFFGNKGAGITAIVLFLAGMILTGSSVRKFLLSLLSCLGLAGWKPILLFVIDFAGRLGVSSYALTTFRIMLSADADIVFSSRSNLWNTASEWIKEKPIFGYGVGAFEIANNGYVHNVFYEVALSFGIAGLVVFIAFLLHSIMKMLQNPCKEYKVFQAVCLGCWLIPMQFSLTMWNVSVFWVYWGMYLYDNASKGRRIKSLNSNL